VSQGNAEGVTAIFDHLSRGDVDGALSAVAPSFELDWTRSLTGMNGVYTDRDEVRAQWLATFVEPWEWVEFDLIEVTEVDPDRVLCISRARMQGRGSGAEVSAEAASIWTFAGGSVVKSVMFQTREDAAAALEGEPN
jgi:ketosteroid isomerase-like protein